jgi:hypothetical protein
MPALADRQAWEQGIVGKCVLEAYSIVKTEIIRVLWTNKAAVKALPRDYYDHMRPVDDRKFNQ